jgi:hypothetical protein
MNLKNKILNILLKRFNKFIIDNLTVERSKNRRKYIWKTQHFREVTQIYIPRTFFTLFVVIMCWKIHEKVKMVKKSSMVPYFTVSHRQEKINKDKKVKDLISFNHMIY